MRIGRYEVERELAPWRGARVYVAANPATEQKVAVVVLPPESGDAAAEAARFRRDIRAASRIRHPHLLPVLGAGRHESSRFTVLDWTEGDSLETLAARRPPPAPRALARWIAEACEAVAHLHENGYVHGRLDAAALWIATDGRCLVRNSGLTESRDAVDRDADRKALGGALARCLAGSIPQHTGTKREGGLSAQSPSWRRLLGAERDLALIAAKATARNRDLTYPALADMSNDLRRYLAGRPVQAPAPNAGYRALQWARRNRRIVAACAAAITLGLIAPLLWSAVRGVAREVRSAYSREQAEERAGELLARAEALDRGQLSERTQSLYAEIAALPYDLAASARAHLRLAQLHRVAAPPRSDLAATEFALAYRIAPESADGRAALLGLAETSMERGEFELARESLRAFRSDPSNQASAEAALAGVRLGECLERLGDPRAASAQYTAAKGDASLPPAVRDTLERRAAVLRAVGAPAVDTEIGDHPVIVALASKQAAIVSRRREELVVHRWSSGRFHRVPFAFPRRDGRVYAAGFASPPTWPEPLLFVGVEGESGTGGTVLEAWALRDGTAAPVWRWSTGMTGFAMASLADLDGDSRADLAAAVHFYGRHVWVFPRWGPRSTAPTLVARGSDPAFPTPLRVRGGAALALGEGAYRSFEVSAIRWPSPLAAPTAVFARFLGCGTSLAAVPSAGRDLLAIGAFSYPRSVLPDPPDRPGLYLVDIGASAIVVFRDLLPPPSALGGAGTLVGTAGRLGHLPGVVLPAIERLQGRARAHTFLTLYAFDRNPADLSHPPVAVRVPVPFVAAPDDPFNAPRIADLDGDGRGELLVPGTADGFRVYAFSADTGAEASPPPATAERPLRAGGSSGVRVARVFEEMGLHSDAREAWRRMEDAFSSSDRRDATLGILRASCRLVDPRAADRAALAARAAGVPDRAIRAHLLDLHALVGDWDACLADAEALEADRELDAPARENAHALAADARSLRSARILVETDFERAIPLEWTNDDPIRFRQSDGMRAIGTSGANRGLSLPITLGPGSFSLEVRGVWRELGWDAPIAFGLAPAASPDALAVSVSPHYGSPKTGRDAAVPIEIAGRVPGTVLSVHDGPPVSLADGGAALTLRLEYLQPSSTWRWSAVRTDTKMPVRIERRRGPPLPAGRYLLSIRSAGGAEITSLRTDCTLHSLSFRAAAPAERARPAARPDGAAAWARIARAAGRLSGRDRDAEAEGLLRAAWASEPWAVAEAGHHATLSGAELRGFLPAALRAAASTPPRRSGRASQDALARAFYAAATASNSSVRARAFSALGRSDLAVDALRQAALADPGGAADRLLAEALFEDYRLDESLAAYERVLKRTPRSHELFLARAGVHRRLWNREQALADLRSALLLPISASLRAETESEAARLDRQREAYLYPF